MDVFGFDLRTVLAISLGVAAAAVVFVPSMWPQIQKMFAGLKKPPAAVLQPVSVVHSDVPAASLDDQIRQRALSLRAACPKADTELRLRWLEAGFDDCKARIDYIAELEKRLEKPTP